MVLVVELGATVSVVVSVALVDVGVVVSEAALVAPVVELVVESEMVVGVAVEVGCSTGSSAASPPQAAARMTRTTDNTVFRIRGDAKGKRPPALVFYF